MRAVYLKRPIRPPNRLEHNNTLGPEWYSGQTGLLPVDDAIRTVNDNAYLHHIMRLMVVGNAMFLCEIEPSQVYRWFMEMFADSWDWVMVGNVYYMSQWCSDAITTKPYISSSAYIARMSDYGPRRSGQRSGQRSPSSPPWTDAWDCLYWNTIRRLRPLLRRNYRMAAQVSIWDKKSSEEKQDIEKRANRFLRQKSHQ